MCINIVSKFLIINVTSYHHELHLNNKRNSVFAKHILYFIEIWIRNTDIFDKIRVRHILKPIWHEGGVCPLCPPLPINYAVIKHFLIGLASWALFYSHKIFIFTLSVQIWINSLQRVIRYDLFVKERVIRYDLFVKERYNISSISETYKKLFICIPLKHRYIPRINNLLLIPALFVRPMMTCLWRHCRLHDVLWGLNKQKKFFTI